MSGNNSITDCNGSNNNDFARKLTNEDSLVGETDSKQLDGIKDSTLIDVSGISQPDQPDVDASVARPGQTLPLVMHNSGKKDVMASNDKETDSCSIDTTENNSEPAQQELLTNINELSDNEKFNGNVLPDEETIGNDAAVDGNDVTSCFTTPTVDVPSKGHIDSIDADAKDISTDSLPEASSLDKELVPASIDKVKTTTRGRRGSRDRPSLTGMSSRRSSRNTIDHGVVSQNSTPEERRSSRLKQRSQERELEAQNSDTCEDKQPKELTSVDNAISDENLTKSHENNESGLVNGIDGDTSIGSVRKRHRRYSRFERFDDEDGANSTATEDDEELDNSLPPKLELMSATKCATDSREVFTNSESEPDSSFVTLKNIILDMNSDSEDNTAAGPSAVSNKSRTAGQKHHLSAKKSIYTSIIVSNDNTKSSVQITESKGNKNPVKKRINLDNPKASQFAKNSSPQKRMEDLLGKRKSLSPKVHKARKSFSTGAEKKSVKKSQRAKMSLSPNRLSTITIDSFFKPVEVEIRKMPTARKTLAYASKKKMTNDSPLKIVAGSLSVDVDSSSPGVESETSNELETTITSDDATRALSALQTDGSKAPNDLNVMPSDQYASDAENNPVEKPIKMPKARKSFPRSKNCSSTEALDKWARARSGDAMAAAAATVSTGKHSTPKSTSYKIRDLESVFGISKKIEKLDAKTLDKLLLDRALKSKDRTSKMESSAPEQNASRKIPTISHSSFYCKAQQTSGTVSESQLEATEMNFASLITTQRLLTKRKKKRRLGTYNLPSHKKKPKKLPTMKPKEQNDTIVSKPKSVSGTRKSVLEDDSVKLENSDQVIPAVSLENLDDSYCESPSDQVQEETESRFSRGTKMLKSRRYKGKRKPKKKKLPKYIRARLRDMQKRFHMQGSGKTQEMLVPGLESIDQQDFIQKITRKRKRPSTGDEDALSVTSTTTSLAESENSVHSKETHISKRRRGDDTISLLSPVSSIPIVNHSHLSNASPPILTPQKISGRSLFKPSPLKRPKLSQGLECLNAVPGALRHRIEGASGAGDNKFEEPLPYKFHNTPNGLTYPVTPPHTPEHSVLPADGSLAESVEEHEILGSDRRSDYVTVCCCKVTAGVAAGTVPLVKSHLYCQALDSVNGKIMGCCNKVTNSNMVRPSHKIPFMALCEVHRQRLKMHQCCPGCGQFCTEGKFLQCKNEVGKKGGVVLHHFHIQCQTYKANKCYCPHCAQESEQHQVVLKFNGPRSSWAAVEMAHPSADGSEGVRNARMGSVPPPSLHPEEEASSVEVPVTATNKVISSKSLPLGPSRVELETALSILDSDRAKKLRQGKIHLFKACRVGDVEKTVISLADGSDPNTRYEDENNQSALHAAAGSGYHLIVHLLLQAGANPQVQDNNLATPLMLAAEKGHMQVIQILVKSGALLDAKRSDGMTSLHLAAQSGKVDAVRFLLETKKIHVNVKDDGGWTPLIWAAEHSHLEVVHYLLASDTDPNMRDNEGNTALHWAAFSGSTAIAEIFLNANCDLETVNELGDRPLHIAARQDHYECVVLFLARGADSEARNNENEAPIGCCVDPTTPTWMALRVNRQLQGVAARKLQPPERLVHRDISFGREANPMPVVNMVDDDNYPTDFLYVAENVETTPMNVNRLISSLQACVCKENCGSVFCDCSHNSVKCWYEKDGKLVKEFIYSEPPLIFECNKACRCWSGCQNRVVQLGVSCRLQVFRTSGRGWGARSLLDIPRGSFVCEYIGELISDADADSREDDSYLFDLDNKDTDTYCIDARRYGNVARFINHLCQPNLIPVKVFVDHQDLRFPRICFFASRDIKAYEELGFDYGEKFWIIKWKQFTCTCGSPRCRYSKDTIHKTLEEYNRRQVEEDQLME